jgi:DHA1 family inner membrane transport protein
MMLVIFIVGNLLSAMSIDYAVLLVARIVAAFAHGTLFGVGAVVAAELVPANRRASAIALMFTGLTLANIIGVPLGTLIGQTLGWHATFWAITGLGLLSLSAVAVFVPGLASTPSRGLAHEFTVLRRPQVLLALATTVLGWGCVFALFTYVVPILEDVTGFSPRAVTAILFVIGVGLTIGINLGGRLSDRGLMRALIGTLITVAALSAAFALASHNKIAAVAVIFLWGVAAFATLPPLQTRVLDSAKGAPNLASTLNVGAFNLGNAGGAFVGGQAIAWGFGLTAVPLVAALVALSGLAAAGVAATLDRRRPLA